MSLNPTPRPPAPHIPPPTLAERLPVLAAVVLGVMALGRAWVTDDAFITFRVVDMLWNGHGPVFNPGERVQAYTHPLWFFYLALGGRLGFDLYYVAAFGGVACAAATGYLIARMLPPLSTIVVVALLATSSAFLDFSTSGLENSLTHLLVAGMLWTAFGGDGPLDAARARRLVLFGGLTMLNRLDLALLVGPMVGLVIFSRPRSVVGLFPVALWLLLAAWYYGTPFPNTMYAKVGAFSTGESLRHGLSYITDYLLAEPFHALMAALAVAMGIRAGRSKSWPEVLRREQLLLLACCAGVLLYVLYFTVVGGDFMRGRMFTTPFLMAMLVGGMVLTVDGPALTPVTSAVAVALSVGALLVGSPGLRDSHFGEAGIGNERAQYPWLWLSERRGEAQPPLGLDRPDSLGRSLRTYAETYGPITVRGSAAGQYGYYAGDKVTIIDALGLTDAYIAREAPRENQRPGHINRNVMTDYYRVRADITLQRDWLARIRTLDPKLREEALKAAESPEWSDKQAQRRYQDVLRLVAGSLAARDRIGVIFKHLRPVYSHPDRNEVLVQSGEISVRANYRPIFGGFQTLIGMNEGAGDGADWFDPKAAVSMNDLSSQVTIDLGADHTLNEVALQGDANDTYLVRFSTNGKDFGQPWIAGPVEGAGLRTRRTPEGFSVKTRFLRVEVVAGDSFFSLGRLDVVTEAGRPARAPGRPGWPAEAAVVAGDGQVALNWKAPTDGGRKISKYTIRSTGGEVETTVDGQTLATTITGLQNGSEYRFTVTATNEVGEGPASVPSNAVTPTEKVVATRGNVKVRANFTPRSGTFAALLVDPFPPDGTAFLDANLAFAWNDPASRVTIDLGQSVAITRIIFQGDNNDTFVMEFSEDGRQFTNAQLFAPTGAPGLRTRETPAGFSRTARYLRLGGSVGDSTFALGALEVFTTAGPVIRR